MSTFQREELLGVLEVCRPALGAIGHIPELSHFWFDGKNVCAYDGGLGIRRKLESDLNCGIPGKVLLGLLNTSALREVSIVQTKEGVTLQMGNRKVQVAFLSAERRVWPFPLALPKEDGLALTEAIFAALGKIQLVKASKATQVLHQGVSFVVRHEAVDLYATDSVTAAHFRAKQRSVSMPLFTMPWAMAGIATKLLAGSKRPQLWLRDDCLIAGAPGTLIASNLLDLARTPSIEELMSQRFVGKLDPLPKGLHRLLDRATVLAGVKDPFISIAAGQGAMRLYGHWSMGKMDEDLDTGARSKGGLVKVKIRADMIARALPMADRYRLDQKSFLLAGGETFRYLVSTKETVKKG